ncbi:MAG: TM2 domain-containing protein [Chitinophagaceae bacterium]|nr:TM2 domain-containing protein [Chitinophagaceae bacterium]
MDVMLKPATKKCPFCAEEIRSDAIKCRHCGEIVDPIQLKTRNAELAHQLQNVQRERKWSPGVAALLSFLIPGAGQLYKGNVMSGLLWFVFTGIGYFLLFVPGLILHFFCIIAAASGNPYK